MIVTSETSASCQLGGCWCWWNFFACQQGTRTIMLVRCREGISSAPRDFSVTAPAASICALAAGWPPASVLPEPGRVRCTSPASGAQCLSAKQQGSLGKWIKDCCSPCSAQYLKGRTKAGSAPMPSGHLP
eukprot:14098139-Alexandrium_andersonii.AAC.1